MIIPYRVKQYGFIIVILFLLGLLAGYFKDKLIVALGGYTDQTTTTTIDSTFVTGKIDTIAVFNHYVTTKGIILNPKAKIVYKYKNPLIEIGERIDSLKEFNVKVKDSLIDGNMVITNKFNGDLESSILTYKPLFPKYIKRVDTVFINKTITNTLTNKRSLLGLGVGYSNLQYFSILGSYTTKNNWEVIYEYGKPLSKTIEVINGTPIQFNTNDLHSVKLIKHF